MTPSSTVAGIDTSKARLDIAVTGHDETWQVDNMSKGWRQLARRLVEIDVERVGIEASGGYEQGVVAALRKAGLSVVVLQPMQVKAFARLKLRRAKNDRLDAHLIAAVTALLEPRSLDIDGRLEQLAHHLTFIEQSEEDIVRCKTRLEHIREPRLRRITLDDIERLKSRRRTELARLARALRAHDDLARRLALVLSVPGIGLRTALTLIVRMPELGQISREQAAALAGLAPFDDDSGDRAGQRRIAGGRARVRRALFAAALPAAFRWNTALVDLYRRLSAANKPHNLALVACARKLLIFANTVLARGTPWVHDARPA